MASAAIIGRPNTGKSSLFNRITGRREAIVDDMPGVTRDRIYGAAEWRDKTFYVIDTGGILGEESAFSAGIESHVNAAIEECDAIIMVMDGRAGVTPSDMEVANLLRRSRKPVIIAVNKLDDIKHDDKAAEAWELGFEHVVGISALHMRNLDDLLDLLTKLLPDEEHIPEEEGTIRLSIVGRPNVGKSSMLNRLTGTDRSLVSPIAGTTRDPVDTTAVIDGQPFRIVDTAGLRRRGKMDSSLEYYSFVRTLSAVDKCDAALLIMDAESPCTDQDKRIASHIVQKGKALVIVLNKWDLTSGDKTGDKLRKKIRDEMPFLSWAPILFTSALSGRGVQRIAPAIKAACASRASRIPTNALNRLMRDVLAFDRLPSDKRGRVLKIYYCSQADVNPPTFVFFVNDPNMITTAFENHIRNELRRLGDSLEEMPGGFSGTPIRIFWRGKDKE